MSDADLRELELLLKLELLKARYEYTVERLRKLLVLAPPPDIDPAQVSSKEYNFIKVRRRAYVSAGRWLQRVDAMAVTNTI